MKYIKIITTGFFITLLNILTTNAQSFSFVGSSSIDLEKPKMAEETDTEEILKVAVESTKEEFLTFDKMLEMNFSQKSNPNFYFKILDINDNVIYSGSLHNLYSLKFDPNKLTPGRYYLNLQNKDFFISKGFSVGEKIKA